LNPPSRKGYISFPWLTPVFREGEVIAKRGSMLDFSQFRRIVVLTGAGISAESGVPTFRGEEGLWRQYRPEELATPRAFARDPELVWEWYDWRRGLIGACQPNAAHRILADMEASLPDFTLITQNVDGLHRLAGGRRVLELHGNIWRMRCTRQGTTLEDRTTPLPDIPPHCADCGALLRPDVVWFGEGLPGDVLEAAFTASGACDLILVVGTSAVVQPAATLPLIAMQNGAALVEINPQPTPLSDYADLTLRQPAAQALPQLCETWQSQLSHR
jgi:NAD-dependent deacetylase